MRSASPESATDRLQRVLYTATGIGAVVFGALMLSGPSGMLAQRASLAPWYWWTSMIVALALPASFVAIAPLATSTARRTVARVAVIGFLAVEALWVPAMTVESLPDGTTPWIQGITAMSSTIAGITWTSRWVWAFPLLQGPIVAAVQLLSTERAVVGAVLDGVGALIFCSILTGVAQAVLRAGQVQDLESAAAQRAAMAAASSATRDRERARINAIVHDDIMSVLLAASRGEHGGEVAERARDALASIETIAHPRAAIVDATDAAHLEAVLRATVRDVGCPASFVASRDGAGELPGAVVPAMAEALAEALRNVERHAGTGASCQVTLDAGPDGVRVGVDDDGLGFDPRAVGATRLGIRTSIEGRMAMIPGGTGAVLSAPGAGTRVVLAWSRP